MRCGPYMGRRGRRADPLREDRPVVIRGVGAGSHPARHRSTPMTRLPYASTPTSWPGWTSAVVVSSSITSGPSAAKPAGRSSRSEHGGLVHAVHVEVDEPAALRLRGGDAALPRRERRLRRAPVRREMEGDELDRRVHEREGVLAPVLDVERRLDRRPGRQARRRPARARRAPGRRSACRRSGRGRGRRAPSPPRRSEPPPRARARRRGRRARRRRSASVRSTRVWTRSSRGSVSSIPQAENTPERGGTTTFFTPSSAPSAAACMAPPPPQATSTKSRGS